MLCTIHLRAVLYCLLNFDSRIMTIMLGFCSPFMAASEHRVVTHHLSCSPMAIYTYLYLNGGCRFLGGFRLSGSGGAGSGSTSCKHNIAVILNIRALQFNYVVFISNFLFCCISLHAALHMQSTLKSELLGLEELTSLFVCVWMAVESGLL